MHIYYYIGTACIYICVYIVPMLGCMEFSMEELEQATEKFCTEMYIGGGGYGQVYRGCLRHSDVAVKILSQVHGGLTTAIVTVQSNIILNCPCRKVQRL